MKKSIAYAVSRGLVLAALSQTALADGVTYGITWEDSDQSYHIFMTPDATPAVDRTLSAQVTLRLPQGTLPAAFSDASIGLTSAHSGANWSASSRAIAPSEDSTVDYVSFTPTISDPTTFALVAGQRQEIFSFNTGTTCLGVVEIMDNDTDPFNNPPAGQVNSVQSNPGNEFSSLMWTATDNDFLGIEADGGTADCRTTSANNNPVAGADSATVEQGSAVDIDVLNNDSDTDGDNLIIASKTDGTHGVVTIINDSLIEYIADAEYVGSDTFTYTLSDGQGGSATATVSVNITAQQATNASPVAVPDTATVVAGSSIDIDVLNNDTDSDLNSLTLTTVGQAGKGATSISNGQVRYVADSGASGADSFTYTISDGNGGEATGTVNVTITIQQSTNASPVAVSDTATVVAGSSIDIDVLDNDTDSDSDSLTLTAVGQAGKGAASMSNGQVRYVAGSDSSGTDSFTYTVSDGNGGEATGTVNVTISVATAPDNDADGVSNDDEAILGTDPDSADSEGDGISDLYELGASIAFPVDTDDDGIIDALDDDDDNDSILTIFENYNGGLPTNDDTDRDGTPDYLDADDDNDGLLTYQEQPAVDGNPNNGNARDTDGDGRPDYLQGPGGFSFGKQAPIPTLTQWAQILLSMLLGLVALGGFWRKNSDR